MKNNPPHNPSQMNWRDSEEITYTEKNPNTKAPKTSKRRVCRLIKLGVVTSFTIAALVLTLIVLVVGRHGSAGSDLALINVNMTNFARFNPPTIQLVHNTTDTNATLTRRGLGSWASDVKSAVGSAETAAKTIIGGAASAVETAAQSVATVADAEADKIIGEIGNGIHNIENAVMGLMDKVLGTIQTNLNDWLRELAGALGSLDVPRQFSLHLTTYCKANAGNSTGNYTSDVSQTSCNRLFRHGKNASFNSTSSNGTIFGFQPGKVIAEVLGIFMVPQGAQQNIREPVDSGVNTVNRLVQEAEDNLSSWSINLLFIPIVVVYALACFFASLLLLLLILGIAFSVRDDEGLPVRVFSVMGKISVMAAFFLLLGSVTLTVVAMMAHMVGLGADVVGISISSGFKLKWISWAAFFLMVVVTLILMAEEVVAEISFWWSFAGKLFRTRKTKESVRDVMRGL